MMKKKQIENWYEDTKKTYEEYENNYDMPEGDFNELKMEYDTLRAILEVKD